jgi:sulfur carrier protein
MTVNVNGKPQALQDGATLTELVQALGLGEKRVAIEVNRELVTRGEWAGRVLRESDKVEIVSFVGGG